MLSNYEQPNKEDASLDHLRTQYRVTLSIWQILHAQQRAAPVEEILRHGNEVEAALGSLLESTNAANAAKADTAPEEKPAKAATKKGTRNQCGKGNGRSIPVTENSLPAPTKKRGTSRTLKTPVKRRAIPVSEDEQEDTPSFPFTSKKGELGPELFEDSDKFFQLLGRSRSKAPDCWLNSQIARRYGSKPIRSPWPDQIENQVAGSLGTPDEGSARKDHAGS